MNNKLKKIFPFLARNEWKQKAEKKKHIPSTEEILSTIPIFSNLNKGELKLVAGILHKRKYKKMNRFASKTTQDWECMLSNMAKRRL